MNEILNSSAPRIKGADVSSLLEVEQAGGKFYDAPRWDGDAPRRGGHWPSAEAVATEHAFPRTGKVARSAG